MAITAGCKRWPLISGAKSNTKVRIMSSSGLFAIPKFPKNAIGTAKYSIFTCDVHFGMVSTEKIRSFALICSKMENAIGNQNDKLMIIDIFRILIVHFNSAMLVTCLQGNKN